MKQQFSLSGFSGRITQGTCDVVLFERPARRKRAWIALGKSWGVAAGCVFIPVVHFLLVPSFLVFGVYQFIDKIGTAELVREAHAACPDCGTEQAFELGRRRAHSTQVSCARCHRGLTVSFPVSS